MYTYLQLSKKHYSITGFLSLKICVGYAAPFYIDAFVGSQKVKAVEDPVAGDLDIIHWRKRGKQTSFSLYVSGSLFFNRKIKF